MIELPLNINNVLVNILRDDILNQNEKQLLDLWIQATRTKDKVSFITAMNATHQALEMQWNHVPILAPLNVFDKTEVNLLIVKPHYLKYKSKSKIFDIPSNFYPIDIIANYGYGSYSNLNHQILNLSRSIAKITGENNFENDLVFEFIPTWKVRLQFLVPKFIQLFDEESYQFIINLCSNVEKLEDTIYESIVLHESGHKIGILPLYPANKDFSRIRKTSKTLNTLINGLYDLSADVSLIDEDTEYETIFVIFTYHFYNLYNAFVLNDKNKFQLENSLSLDYDTFNSFIICNELYRQNPKSISINCLSSVFIKLKYTITNIINAEDKIQLLNKLVSDNKNLNTYIFDVLHLFYGTSIQEKHEPKIINLACIGYGASASYFHMPVLKKMRSVNLIAVADPTLENQHQAQLDGFAFTFNMDNYVNQLKITNIHLCLVCSPNAYHYEQSLALLKNGFHVICEKPLCIHFEELQELIDLAKAQNLVLCPFHNRRYDDEFIKLQKCLSKIGTIQYIDITVSSWGLSNQYASKNFNPEWRALKKYGGGMFNDWMPHIIDKLLNMIGFEMPDVIQSIKLATQWTKDCDDLVAIQYYWKQKNVFSRIMISSINYSSKFHQKSERIKIYGNGGIITVFGDDVCGEIEVLENDNEITIIPYQNTSNNMISFYEQTIQAIQSKNLAYQPIPFYEFELVYKLIDSTLKKSFSNYD